MIVEYINEDSGNHESIFWNGSKAETHKYVKNHAIIRVKNGIAGAEFQNMYEKTIKGIKSLETTSKISLELKGTKVAELGDIELYSVILYAKSNTSSQQTQIPFRDLVTKKQLDTLVELTNN